MDNSKANLQCVIRKRTYCYIATVWNKKDSCSTDGTIFWKTALLNSLILYLIPYPYFENNTSLLNTAQASLNVILPIKGTGGLKESTWVHCFSYSKENLVTLRNFAQQSGDITLSWRRVTRKSSRMEAQRRKYPA